METVLRDRYKTNESNNILFTRYVRDMVEQIRTYCTYETVTIGEFAHHYMTELDELQKELDGKDGYNFWYTINSEILAWLKILKFTPSHYEQQN
jgi:hypothetical protein